MKAHLTPNSEQPIAPKVTSPNNMAERDVWEENGFTIYESDAGYCFVKKKRFPLHNKIGKYDINDYKTAVTQWQSHDRKHPLSAKGYADSDLFFFDTESTGLGHGVGNHLFILGHAKLESDELILTQHILPEPGLEVPLYKSFLSECNVQALVTYNGKAFDWPLVETKHSLIRREVPKLPSFGHFDLFHACKRLFKHQLSSMKLSVIEKDVLGISRTDDVPGYLSGMIYQDYLQRKNPEGMFALALHNERDILALVALYTHLSFLVHKQTKTESSVAFEIGRWEASSGNREEAIQQFELLSHAEAEWDEKIKYELASEYKKAKQLLHAIPLWKDLSNHSSGYIRIQSCIELAKWYEHKEKMYSNALQYTTNALDTLVDHEGISRGRKETIFQELMKRKLRLLKKLSS